MNPFSNLQNWVVASFLLPGGQDKIISLIFPHFPSVPLIFPQIFFNFFLVLIFWMGKPHPGYATAFEFVDRVHARLWPLSSQLVMLLKNSGWNLYNTKPLAHHLSD